MRGKAEESRPNDIDNTATRGEQAETAFTMPRADARQALRTSRAAGLPETANYFHGRSPAPAILAAVGARRAASFD